MLNMHEMYCMYVVYLMSPSHMKLSLYEPKTNKTPSDEDLAAKSFLRE